MNSIKPGKRYHSKQVDDRDRPTVDKSLFASVGSSKRLVSCAAEKKTEILDILNNKSMERLDILKAAEQSYHDLY